MKSLSNCRTDFPSLETHTQTHTQTNEMRISDKKSLEHIILQGKKKNVASRTIPRNF